MNNDKISPNTILETLDALDGNVLQTAKKLGISRSKVYRTLRQNRVNTKVVKVDGVDGRTTTKMIETQIMLDKDGKRIEERTVFVKQANTGETLYSTGKPLNNPAWESFAQFYVSPQTRGMALNAWCTANEYEPTNKREYNHAKAQCYKWLRNQQILDRIRELMDVRLSHELADQELGFLMTQHENLNAKLGAVKLYNEIVGRIGAKIQITEKTARDRVMSRLFGEEVQDAEVVDED